MVEKRGLADQFEIDSAATESYNEMCHAGIHHGTCEMLKSMHVPFEEHYSRRIRPRDYAYYDSATLRPFNRSSVRIRKTKSIACLIGPPTRATFAILGIPETLMRATGIFTRDVRRF